MGEIAEAESSYKILKKELKKKIISSKNRCWMELCDELDNDIWDTVYRLATNRIRHTLTPYDLSEKRKEELTKQLFPATRDIPIPGNENCEEPPPWPREELINAAAKLKNKKSPGIDGILPESIKIIAELFPDLVLKVMNKALR